MRSKKSLLAAVVTLGLGACGTTQQTPSTPDPLPPDPEPPVMKDPPKMFSLTSGADSFTGADTDDIFQSSVSGGLGAGDVLDGAGGKDTLTVNETAAIAPDNVTVRNIEQASLTSMGTVKVDTTSWTGLASLTTQSQGGSTVTAAPSTAVSVTAAGLGQEAISVNGGGNVSVTATGATTGLITVGKDLAPAGAVAVSNTSIGAGSMGDIMVNGGKSVSVTQGVSNDVNTTAILGDVVVNGNADTTSVSFAAPPAATASATVAGVQLGTFAVVDVNANSDSKAGTITSVSATNYRTIGIAGNAVQSLSLTNGSGHIIIDNSGLTTPTQLALAARVNGLTGGVLDDADIYKSLAITTEGKPSRLSNCTFGALETLQLAGDQPLSFTSTAGMQAIKTVAVTGAAGLVADFSGSFRLTSLDASATSGDLRVTLDPSRTLYKGGAGADNVTLVGGAPAFDLPLGAGDDSVDLGSRSTLDKAIAGGEGLDTLGITAAFAASSAATIASFATGFEHVRLAGATNQTIDLSALGSGYRGVTTSGGNGLTLNNFPGGGTFVLSGAGTAYTLSNSAFSGGSDDALNLRLQDGSGAGVAFASTGITAAGVENININSLDTQATPAGTFSNTVTLLGNSVKNITLSGNTGFTLTAMSTALTSLDASQLTAKSAGFTWTTGALSASSVTIKGSAAGTNTLNATAATGSIHYTGGSGADVITINTTKDHVVALGDGNNVLTLGRGNNTVSAGGGNDSVTTTGGNNSFNLGDGNNTLTFTSGTNTVVTGSGDDTITFGGTAAAGQTINVGSGKDTVVLTAAPASAAAFTTLSGVGTGDILNLSETRGGSASISLQTGLGARVTGQSTLADYLNACAADDAGTFTVIKWFQFEGNTYIVHDTSAMGTFQDGADTVIKLSGQLDLSSATVAGGVITL